MFGFFKRKPLLHSTASEWIFDAYEWALRNVGTDIFYGDTILVQPTSKHFPDRIDDIDRMAETLFERVKGFAGMQNWRCELHAQEVDPDPIVSPTVVIKGAPSSPAGTFSVRKSADEDVRTVRITYNPDQLRDPGSLIATFAHELAHYEAHSIQEEPPGGEECDEHATDLLAVFNGFGIFLANSAFSFQQFQSVDAQGWSSRRQGYLNQYELIYALAIFCVLKSIGRAEIEPHLKRSLIPSFRKAIREIEAGEDIARLKSIESFKKTPIQNSIDSQTP
jgi:hypothetical protein